MHQKIHWQTDWLIGLLDLAFSYLFYFRFVHPWQVTKEVQTSERVLLECHQVIQNMTSNTEIDNVQPKQVSSALDKLKNRLSPALLELYAQNWDTENSEGMACLEKLRSHEAVLTQLVPFIKAWHDAKANGHEILELSKQRKGPLYQPPSIVSMKALTRDLDQALAEERYSQIVTLLLKQEDASKEEGILQIEGEQERKQFVERELIKAVVSLLRKQDKVAQVSQVVKCIYASGTAWQGYLPADGMLVKDLDILQCLLKPMDTTVPQDRFCALHFMFLGYVF